MEADPCAPPAHYRSLMESARRPSRFDLIVAAALMAAAVAESLTTSKYDVRVELPLAIAFALPLVWRRVAPLAVVIATMVVLVVQRLLFGEIWDAGSTLAVPLVVVFAAGAYAPLVRSIVGLVLICVTMSISDIGDGSDFAFITLLCTAMWIAGRAMRRQRELVAQVRDQARQLEAAQAERELFAVADERSRIARELHDVIAHSVSMIVVQAEAGQAMVNREPERAAASFEAIQDTGRKALDELRTMLGVLRPDGSRPSKGPQPGLRSLETLLESARTSGLHVDLTVEGEPRELPAGVDLSAYRVVQEALTNTRKHSAATRARVDLRYLRGAIEVSVSDNGNGAATTATTTAVPGSGHGLVGMAERARLHGGELEVRREPTGFTVTAKLATP